MIGLSRPTTVFLLTTWLFSQLFVQSHAAPKPNVLFIAVDDLNDWVGCLGGHPNAKTPNIDRLAERGMLFTNATCPSPICNPSRTSIMTGLLPSTTGIYMNHPFFRDVPQLKDAVTLPQYFRQHGGYKTLRTGKIYHHSKAPTDPASWDKAFPSLDEHKPFSSAPTGWDYLNKATLWDTGPLALADEEMDDGLVANWAIEQLGKTHEKPFFLAVGMYHPHLPVFAPRKYYDMHPLDQIELPIVNANDRDDIPKIAYTFNNGPRKDLYKTFNANEQLWKEKVQGYLAATSFADAQIGRVLDALEKSPHADNTLIVLWSDHGFHHGEKLHWSKFTLWDESARVPLILAGKSVAAGTTCDAPVSLVNLYPTLVNLCGLPKNDANEGVDLTPLLQNPIAEWERPALTTHGQGNHSLRTKRWRYTRWADGSEELYDHANDPEEWTNQAENPECESLKQQLSNWFPQHNASDAMKRAKARKKTESGIGQHEFDGKYWSALEPVDTTVPSGKTLEIVLKDPLMKETGFLRRDSSDIIRVDGKYHIWYTKVYKDQSSYPEGAAGSVWYATSTDGYQWEEQGESIPRGDAGAWDDAGVYTPNILVYEGMYYLGFTGSKLPFPEHDQYSSSIGIAVSSSPDGPWKKLDNNPLIKPSLAPGTPDGIIVDDSLFVVNDGKIWMYYKGNPNSGTQQAPRRTFGNTFLLAATADHPEGPYTKLRKVLHRGHEGVLWKTEDGGFGSLATSRGPLRYMYSENGTDFKAVYNLITPKAPSIYRPDFEEGNKGFRPTWGVAQKSKRIGLHRIEFIWPEE